MSATQQPKYRVIEFKPGKFGIQSKGMFWGWNWVRYVMSEGIAYWDTQAEAEAKVKSWVAEEEHTPRIVSEL